MKTLDNVDIMNEQLFNMIGEIVQLPSNVRELELRLNVEESPILYVTYYPSPVNKLTLKTKKYIVRKLVVDETSSTDS